MASSGGSSAVSHISGGISPWATLRFPEATAAFSQRIPCSVRCIYASMYIDARYIDTPLFRFIATNIILRERMNFYKSARTCMHSNLSEYVCPSAQAQACIRTRTYRFNYIWLSLFSLTHCSIDTVMVPY